MSNAAAVKEENQLIDSFSYDHIVFRKVKKEDFDRGFLDVFRRLTEVGHVTREEFEKRYDELFPKLADYYKIIVAVDTKRDLIVAAGTVFFEKKFIRNTGTVGHVEDIVSRPDHGSKGLGVKLISVLNALGRHNGAYKVILDCKESLVPFYEKNSYKRNELCMKYSIEEVLQQHKKINEEREKQLKAKL